MLVFVLIFRFWRRGCRRVWRRRSKDRTAICRDEEIAVLSGRGRVDRRNYLSSEKLGTRGVSQEVGEEETGEVG